MSGRFRALVVAWAMLAVAAAACDSKPVPTPTPTTGTTIGTSPAATTPPSPTVVANSRSPEPSPSPSPTAPAGPTPMPTSESNLEPGTYAYPGFVPPLTLRVGPGWIAGHQVGDFFDVDSPDAVVVFAEVGFVYDEQGVRRPAASLSPHDAAALLAKNRDMGAGPVEPATVGGVRGYSVELTPRRPDNMLGRTVVYYVASDRSYRVSFVRVDGVLLAITAVSIHRPPDKAFAEIEPVIGSVRFAAA